MADPAKREIERERERTYLFNMINNCYLRSPRFKKCITLKLTKRSNQYLQARAKSRKKLERKKLTRKP